MKKSVIKEFKKVLIDKELSFVKLSRDLGVSRKWLWLVVSGRTPGTKLKREIAELFDMEFEELWEFKED